MPLSAIEIHAYLQMYDNPADAVRAAFADGEDEGRSQTNKAMQEEIDYLRYTLNNPEEFRSYHRDP